MDRANGGMAQTDVNFEVDELSSVVLIRLGAIGEAVSLLPSLKYLTDRVSEENITLISEDVVARVVNRDFPEVNHLSADRFFSNRSPTGLFDLNLLSELVQLLRDSRSRQYDFMVCFHTIRSWTNGLKPHFFNLIFDSRTSAGFSDAFLPEWDVQVDPLDDEWEHMYQKNARLTERLLNCSIDPEPWIGVDPRRARNLKSSLKDRTGLTLEEKSLMVCPGAADPWRCWPVKKYKEVLQSFSARYDGNIVFIGTEGERSTSEQIASDLPDYRTYNLCGSTKLVELPELIDSADLFLANDTGPLHMAVARKVPTLGLFGPGLLNPWASYDCEWFRAVYVRDPEDPYLESYQDDPDILHQISVDRVLKELGNLARKEF